MKTTVLRINPALDIGAITRLYASNGIVQVPNFFDPEVAESLTTMLETTIPWSMTFLGPDRQPRSIPVASMASLDQQALGEEVRDMLKRAGSDYGYVYFHFKMISAAMADEPKGHPIHTFTEFLNSDEMIAFGRAATGVESIRKMDAQATLYRPNDFLGLHTDEVMGGVDRVAAYTLGFTRRWRSDWGGQLMFHDHNTGDVLHGLVPRWNTMTLFKVPRLHSVAPVAPYCQGARMSVVGWYRQDA